jgi:hypothetical protein
VTRTDRGLAIFISSRSPAAHGCQYADQGRETKTTRLKEKIAKLKEEVRRLHGLRARMLAVPDQQISLNRSAVVSTIIIGGRLLQLLHLLFLIVDNSHRKSETVRCVRSGLAVRTYTEAAINRLAFWMQSEDPRASVAASNALLDRGYGKPVAPIEMDHHVNEFDGMTEEELGEYIGQQMSKLGIKIEEA